MNKLFFRSLRWKLTRTFTLVTTAALLTAGALGLAALGAIIRPAQLLNEVVIGLGTGWSAMQPVQTALTSTPPDAAAIQTILSQLPDWYRQAPLTAATLTAETGDTPGGLLVVVTDRQGRIAATAPPPADPGLVGAPLTGPLSALVMTALAGQDYTDQTRPGWLRTAHPVMAAAGGPVLGAVVVVANMDTLGRQAALVFLGLAGGVLLVFALLAGMVGTLFGFIATRGLARRLDNLARASAAWRTGDFSTSVSDASGDEIGQLAIDLNFMAADLRDLFQARQELAALEERNRLARDLHDSIKQQAFGISAQISAARSQLKRDPAAAEARLAEAEQLSNQLRRELTSLVRELYSAGVLGQGLPAGLRELAASWARQNAVPVEVEAPPNITLPEPMALALYRVAQEALSNIARHAGAQHVQLSLHQEGERLVLQIQDDGRGFDEQAIQPGLGLRSMRERLAAMGGAFILDSTPGRGTTIRVSMITTQPQSGHW
jgi:two-component system, NarL family, sensor histidine kinase LiaS